MAVIKVRGKADLERCLEQASVYKLVVIDHFAPWCGPCVRMAPQYEELARRYPQAMFLSIDTEDPVNKAEGIAQAFQIRAFPTFTFHINRTEKERFSGASASKVEDTVTRLLVSLQDDQLAEAIRISTSTEVKPSSAPATTGKSTNSSEIDSLKERIRAAQLEDPEPSGAGPLLDLKVKRITGDTIAIRVHSESSVQHLRRKAALELEVEPVDLRLIFKGKILKDGQTLASAGVDGTDLTVHAAIAGVKHGEKAQSSGNASTASASPSSPSSTAVARLRSALEALEKNGSAKAIVRDCAQVLVLYVRNIVQHPENVSYRSIRQGNKKFSSMVTSCTGWQKVMEALGFELKERDGEPYWVLKAEFANAQMSQLRDELSRFADSVAPAGLSAQETPSSRPVPAPTQPMMNPFAALGGGGFPGAGFPAAGGFPGAGALGGVSPEMLQNLQGNPQFMQASMSLMRRMQENPRLMTSMLNAMQSGQDPMQAMMQDPELMTSMLGMMSDPSIMQGMMSGFGGGASPFGFGGGQGADMSSLGLGLPPLFSPAQTSPAPTEQQRQQSSTNASNAPNRGQQQDKKDDDLDDLDDIYKD